MKRICVLVLIFFTCLLNVNPGVQAIGINYGLLGNNLPPPANTIVELQRRNVAKIRLFEPISDVLTALHGSGISVIVGTRNEDLQSLASNPSAATSWVETHILPHTSLVNITCIAAGNEVFPGDLAQYIPDAMRNLDSALAAANILIPVSTAISMQVLSTSYPPSQGAFSNDAVPLVKEITTFLTSTNNPILVNVYPYFARIGEPLNVKLEYALLEENAVVIPDHSLSYRNLFDAMLDAVYAALEKIGGSNIEIIVTETGWPTDGGSDASIANAQTYINNLIQHVSSGKGTPRRPGKEIDTYIFAMFNENLKPSGVEQHWGLYYPDLTQVYHANF